MKSRIVAVTLAVLLALLGTVAVFAYVHKADQRAVAGQRAVEVYVAKSAVPAGTTLKDAVDQSLIVKELIAAKAVPASSLTDVSSSNESQVAVSEISPGELVLADRFGAQVVSSSGLSIPKGMMAVSVALTDPARVGQFVTVGSDIAVFDTFNVQTADKKGITPSGDHIADNYVRTRATRVLLPRVQVLAVGATTSQSQSSSDQGTAPNGAQNVSNNETNAQQTLLTLAVTQTEAAKLVQAIQTGTLYLALLTDSSQVTTGAGVNDRNLFHGS